MQGLRRAKEEQLYPLWESLGYPQRCLAVRRTVWTQIFLPVERHVWKRDFLAEMSANKDMAGISMPFGTVVKEHIIRKRHWRGEM